MLIRHVRLIALLSLAGCNATGPSTSAAGFVRATVAGALTASYAGTGYFTSDSGPSPSIPVDFTLVSEGEGASNGEMIVLHRIGSGIPEVGRYALTQPTGDGTVPGFFVAYTRSQEVYESFVSQTGEVNIRESSDQHVAGDFEIVALRFCRRAGATVEGACTPLTVAPGAPEITVRGTFSAHRAQGVTFSR